MRLLLDLIKIEINLRAMPNAWYRFVPACLKHRLWKLLPLPRGERLLYRKARHDYLPAEEHSIRRPFLTFFFILPKLVIFPIVDNDAGFPLMRTEPQGSSRSASQSPHFKDEDPEARRGELTHPRSHSYGRRNPRMESSDSLSPQYSLWCHDL